MGKIPKIIHYCWFGGSPLPDQAGYCIKSWQNHLPDYDIIQWNESNFDIKRIQYVKEAYAAQKYAFVADYVRLYALYQIGGIYMDTDVEVLKPLDPFLHHDMFVGLESPGTVQTAVMAAAPKSKYIHRLLMEYRTKPFKKNNGRYDTTANVALISNFAKGLGLKDSDAYQLLDGTIAVYPIEYFCAKDYQTNHIEVTENTCTIHHYAGTWLSWMGRAKIKAANIIGKKNYAALKRWLRKG